MASISTMSVKPISADMFEKALALDSNFVLARQNLDALKSLESGANKVNPNSNINPASPANKQN